MLGRFGAGCVAAVVSIGAVLLLGCSDEGDGDDGPGQRMSGAATVAMYDTDGDAALSPMEVPPDLAANFSSVDADSDGLITAVEIDASQPALGGQGGALGGAGGSGGGLVPSQTCASTEVSTEPGIPTVELVVDRSYSMDDPAPSGQPKWVEACDAVKELVFPLTQEVAFGYHGYTFDASAGNACPTLIEAPAATGNAETLFQTMIDNPPPFMGTTPTAEALEVVADQIEQARAAGDTSARTILLVTDGEPNGCGLGFMGIDGMPRTETAAERICDDAIRMNVIWIGDLTAAATQQHIQRMADLGAGACNDASITGTYFTVQTGQELQQVLTQIVSGLRMCVFELDGKGVSPSAACSDDRSHVTIGGQPIECGPNGWRLTGPTTLEFVGEACALLQTDPNLIVKAEFPCHVIIE